MGKPTGFMEYARALPVVRPRLERLADWREFHHHPSESQLREQGARCMDCGVPFCHTGSTISGATTGCPLNNLIPEWNDLVYRDRWRSALDRLLETNNFPEFTGRVCPAPCEASCVLGINDSPVTIKSIEQAIIDKGFEAGWVVPEPPLERTGRHVAVIGSGPAGLACASQLNSAGHFVTVFDRANRSGGLLMYGIPSMKLDKRVVQRRVEIMSAEGINFLTGINVGIDYPVNRLKDEFDAVVLCGGAARARDLAIEGREFEGIHFALEFLQANTESLLDQTEVPEHLSARNKDVIVIGGGDTGTDCVATALRQGCRSLVQFELLAKPPEERSPENPWPQWPRVYRLDYGQEEAVAVFGQDPRAYSIQSKRFLAEDGRICGVETVEVQWAKNENGQFSSQEICGTEKTWKVQMVLLALGFLGAEPEGLLSALGVRLNERGNVAVDEEKMTNIPGVFAAGDIARGQSLVVWAIADGRRAAAGVDKYLMEKAQASLLSKKALFAGC